MRFCESCVAPLCDTCKHYEFSRYWCELRQINMEPDSHCQEFHCRDAPESKDE